MTVRFLVASAAEANLILRRLGRDGWTARDGFALPESRWDVSDQRLLLHGRVSDADTAELAVLAAVRGAAVIVITDPDADLGRAVLADLTRLGPVGRDGGAEPDPAPAGPGPGTVLLEEQRALLERLANGETIAAAAAAEFLSLRTANRRIAQAREALGVRTTREAVLAYRRLAKG